MVFLARIDSPPPSLRTLLSKPPGEPVVLAFLKARLDNK